MFLLRLTVAIILFASGMFVAARLQEWPDATLVTIDAQKYQGHVSRELLTGDYVVKVDHSKITLDQQSVSVVAWDTSVNSITAASSVAGLFGLIGMATALFWRKRK